MTTETRSGYWYEQIEQYRKDHEETSKKKEQEQLNANERAKKKSRVATLKAVDHLTQMFGDIEKNAPEVRDNPFKTFLVQLDDDETGGTVTLLWGREQSLSIEQEVTLRRYHAVTTLNESWRKKKKALREFADAPTIVVYNTSAIRVGIYQEHDAMELMFHNAGSSIEHAISTKELTRDEAEGMVATFDVDKFNRDPAIVVPMMSVLLKHPPVSFYKDVWFDSDGDAHRREMGYSDTNLRRGHFMDEEDFMGQILTPPWLSR